MDWIRFNSGHTNIFRFVTFLTYLEVEGVWFTGLAISETKK
jgi:hypothetical protein